MPKPPIADPALLSRAPQLTPTARPLAIQAGATPPAQRSPLMELGQAFAEFNPVLRDSLRDAAAREERDAMALGEVEAQKVSAAQKLDDIEVRLKEAADNYEIPYARLPSFQRGFRTRAGSEIATTQFQTDLLSRLNDVAAVQGDQDVKSHGAIVEKAIGEAYNAAVSKIHPDDVYAQSGFHQAAEGIIAGFRQRATEAYAANYQRVAENKIADELYTSTQNLAHANADDKDAYRSELLTGLNRVRSELPKREVNGFYATQVVKPAIDDLIAQHKPSEARALLEDVKTLDVTGKGGLLGETRETKQLFSQLSQVIEREELVGPQTELNRLRASRELATEKGTSLLTDKLAEWRSSGTWSLDKSELERRISEVEGTLPQTHEGRAQAQAFREAALAQFNHDTQNAGDPQAEADFEAQLSDIHEGSVDSLRAQLSILKQGWKISPDRYAKYKEVLDHNEQLLGLVTPEDFVRFDNSAFPLLPKSNTGGLPVRTLNFGALGTPDIVELWDGRDATPATKTNPAQSAVPALPEAMKEDYMSKVREMYHDNLRREYQQVGDVAKAKADMVEIRERAAKKTLQEGVPLLKRMAQEARKQTVVMAQQKQVKAETKARQIFPAQTVWNALWGRTAEPMAGYKVTPEVAKGIKNVETKSLAFIPYVGDDVEKAVAAQKTTPPSEWDVTAVPSYYTATLRRQDLYGKPHILDLRTLADEALAKGTDKDPAKGNPERAAVALKYYGLAKAMLGFTPEEVTKGETKHGIAFAPEEIDPSSIPVFKDKAQLVKEWNSGDYSPLFEQVKAKVRNGTKLHPQDFYNQQLALLSTR